MSDDSVDPGFDHSNDIPGDGAARDLSDLSLEALFEAVRGSGSYGAWDEAFDAIVAHVADRIRSKLRNADIADEAARSALATFLRRVSEGLLDDELDRGDGPAALIGYLVPIAFDRARNKLQIVRPEVQQSVLERGGFEFVDPAPPPVEGALGARHAKISDEEFRARMREEIERQLDAMLVRMGLLLKKARDTTLEESKRAMVFYHLYQKMYGIEKLTDEQIAANVGVSDRMVRRIRDIVKSHWPQLVEEGRRAIRRLRAELLGHDLDVPADCEANGLRHTSNDDGPPRR
jgi:hypothetical protein